MKKSWFLAFIAMLFACSGDESMTQYPADDAIACYADAQDWRDDGIDYKSVLIVPAGADPMTEPAIYVLDRNLGAETLTDYGAWYFWGQTESKIINIEINDCNSDYWDNLTFAQYPSALEISGIQGAYDAGLVTTNDYSTARLALDYDAAHLSLGGDWHIPTKAEWQRFIDGTTVSEPMQDTTTCRSYVEFISKAVPDAKVRMIISGYWNGSRWRDDGSSIELWSATPTKESLTRDYFLFAYDFRFGIPQKPRAIATDYDDFNRAKLIRPFSSSGKLK